MNYYENHNLENKSLPFISRELCVAHVGYGFGKSNWHENVEIIFILSGEGSVFNDGENIDVREDDIIVINSNRLHTLMTKGGKMFYRYLIVDRSFCLENGFDTSSITFDTKISDSEIKNLMRELALLYSEDGNVQYRTPLIRCTVLKIMLILLQKHSIPHLKGAAPERKSNCIKRAIEYICASFDKDLSLDEVSNFVGMNKCYFSREFHKYTGCSFVEYVNRTRCKVAQQLLKEGKMNVCEIGKIVGFPNKSYFAKTFKRYVGMLPGEYRKG